MPLYEVMFIVEPDLESEELEEAIGKVKDVMEKDGGEIVNLKKMGKRKLAYEINDYKEGLYVLVNVRATSKMVGELDHFFKVNEGYMRHMVLRMEEEKEKVSNEKMQEEKEANEEPNREVEVNEEPNKEQENETSI